MASKLPQPDAKWSPRAKTLWQRTLAAFELPDQHQLALLGQACQQLTRADACRAVLDNEGVTTANRHGETRPHPLLAEERSAANAARLLLRELGLDMQLATEARRLPRARGYA